MPQSEEIAYLGPKASYTHQAALSAFNSEEYTLSPQTTIDDVFTSVQAGTASHGVVPFENSTNGSVVFTLDLFADQKRRHPDIVVCGEVYIAVHHCLLGRPASHSTSSSNATSSQPNTEHDQTQVRDPQSAAPASSHINSDNSKSASSSGHATPTPRLPNPLTSRNKPLVPLSHIRKIYSHPQAWGQCQAFLSCHLKNIERQDVSSTSRAAELVAADETGTTAAISSEIAAQLHGLQFLAREIEDAGDNATRFLVLRRRRSGDDDGGRGGGGNGGSGAAIATESSASDGTSGATDLSNGDGDGGSSEKAHASDDGDADSAAQAQFKSLLFFTVSHTDSGALVDSLAVFKRHGINLTSINARPSGVLPWHYIFFVEFQGRRGERRIDGALSELERVVTGWRWLGSWANALLANK